VKEDFVVEGGEFGAQAQSWLSAFDRALAARDVDAAVRLFGDECFWRDLVAFTWNVKTLEGHGEIAAMLRANLAAIAPSGWRIEDDPARRLADGVGEAWLRFETGVGRGRGLPRLRDGKAWTLLTTLESGKSCFA
jgi:putative flavoprotein involved in K+ transport